MSKLFITVSILFLASICSAVSDCKSGYTTTIVVQDNSGAPVGDVNVTISLSCGDQGSESRQTNGQGEAVFNHSADEIVGSKVVLKDNTTALSDGPSGCTGGKNQRCIIRAKFNKAPQ
jgi:hypothetical protein